MLVLVLELVIRVSFSVNSSPNPSSLFVCLVVFCSAAIFLVFVVVCEREIMGDHRSFQIPRMNPVNGRKR